MGITVHIDENRSIRLTDQIIQPDPPGRISFAAEGVISMTEELLGEFEGMALKPVEIIISTDNSHSNSIDLEESPLRLETVDVGVETPEVDGLSPGMDHIRPSAADGADFIDATAGAIAFTVEGEIIDVPEEVLESLTDVSPEIDSITFEAGDSTKSDGGSIDDVMFEFTILGYGIVIRRDGTIEIGTGALTTGMGL